MTAPRRVLAWLVLAATSVVLVSAGHAWWAARAVPRPETYVVDDVDGGTVIIEAPPLEGGALLDYAVSAAVEWQQRDVFTIHYPEWGRGVTATVRPAAGEMTLDFWGERTAVEPWSGETMERWASCLLTVGGLGLTDCEPSSAVAATLVGTRSLGWQGTVVGVQVHLVDEHAESWHELWFGGNRDGEAVLVEVTGLGTWPDENAAGAIDWAASSVEFRPDRGVNHR